LFYSFSLHFLLHNLSWYQSYSSKPLHTGWRATRSSNKRIAYTDLESIRHRLFTRLGELSVILSKDPRRKLPRGSRPSYAQKISVRSSREVAEHTTLESFKEQKHEKEAETEKEEIVKILVQFSKNHQRFMKKSCRRRELLKNSKHLFKFVKDSCRKKKRLKHFGNRSNLSNVAAENKELMKFFQIFERFTNFSSAEENPCKGSKERISGSKNNRRGHKICLANRSEAEIEFRRDEESAEKAKEFQPLDLAQRTDIRWISEKVHEV
jgi:hypothetical protein